MLLDGEPPTDPLYVTHNIEMWKSGRSSFLSKQERKCGSGTSRRWKCADAWNIKKKENSFPSWFRMGPSRLCCQWSIPIHPSLQHLASPRHGYPIQFHSNIFSCFFSFFFDIWICRWRVVANEKDPFPYWISFQNRNNKTFFFSRKTLLLQWMGNSNEEILPYILHLIRLLSSFSLRSERDDAGFWLV